MTCHFAAVLLAALVCIAFPVAFSDNVLSSSLTPTPSPAPGSASLSASSLGQGPPPAASLLHRGSSALLQLLPGQEFIMKDTSGKRRKFRAETKLGEGGMGQVWTAHNVTEPTKRWAIKEMASKSDVEHELKMYKRTLGLPHVLQMIGDSTDEESPLNFLKLPRQYRKEKKRYKNRIAVPLYKCGDLTHYALRNKNQPPECKREMDDQTIAKALFQVLVGLRAMHQLGLAHMDIKLDNVLVQKVDGQPDFAVADLGLTQDTLPTGELQEEEEEEWPDCHAGTSDYVSPLRAWSLKDPDGDIEGRCNGFLEDIWAVGMVGASVCMKTEPFRSEDDDEEIGEILERVLEKWKKRGVLDLNEAYEGAHSTYKADSGQMKWGRCNAELTTAIKLLLTPDERKRSDITDFLLFPLKRLSEGTLPDLHSEEFKLRKWMHDESCPSLETGADLQKIHKCQHSVMTLPLDEIRKKQKDRVVSLCTSEHCTQPPNPEKAPGGWLAKCLNACIRQLPG
uniref:Protein kinase domain-containing protein n=1 Tax=Chromera velia CCMP2878 TaxID=1169474 RepID=A0A0G4HZC6_9ALVE|eukprot:Cvel_9708.t1-p1 / transcript=Cvel_9708.t1 / gene=Cvel_9708 / organism=Chromera_velia_CCMP2878 / gene_product=Mitogen-activated protein kinase homolog MMK1, putative / transcript_product=Mitogen-activated protein kinase homolog MMK1, putative / location=Cvel_scaffold566:58770-60290(+) / protein_length=507 / sequence_SO=supercontig / SO=protein_coding / is_pseudo=false